MTLRHALSAAALAAMACGAASAGEPVDEARLAAAIAAAWPDLTPDLQARVDQDEAQRLCSLHRDNLPADLYEAALKRELASVVFPADGVLMGDWQVGLKEANNGYGGRMGDTNPNRVNGGNCYACHQLDPAEVTYGNLGPSLTGYGHTVGMDEAAQRATYTKIFNAQAVLPCSNMPRFGAHGFLTPEQIRDFVAMLLHPDSPVNK